MYYVLYSPSKKKYLNDIADYCSYQDAERFDKPNVDLSIVHLLYPDLKWVGPCEEGEEP